MVHQHVNECSVDVVDKWCARTKTLAGLGGSGHVAKVEGVHGAPEGSSLR
jgi:hypothetical protein